jgi:flagella basal body P-ring formation protein FlgA
MQRIALLLTIATVLSWNSLQAAEIRLRQQCNPHGSVVVLGDVAEIFSADAEQAEKLAAVELFPAPATSQQRVLRVREVQDILALRGINLTELQFSGSIQAMISTSEHADRDQNLTSSAAKRAHRRLQEAIQQYLQSKTGTNEPRTLQFEATPALARAAAGSMQPISISGGSAPWIGKQRLEAAVDSSEGSVRLPLDVQVAVPTAVVAVVHSLARGAVIREADLALVHDVAGDVGGINRIEDVVGKQTTKAIPDGKILAADDLQTPLIVHKGDVVTVYARSPGIRVRTMARAREDGGLGDLVTLESMNDRKSYQARVCGIRETEVIAFAVPAK